MRGNSSERREQRLIHRQGVALGCVVAEPATLEQAPEAPRDLPCHALHLGVVGWREWVEPQRSFGGQRVDAVEEERVEVDVQVERIAEALHEGDGTAVPAHERRVEEFGPSRGETQRAKNSKSGSAERIAWCRSAARADLG